MSELNKIYQGDCLESLKKMPDDSIDCVVTSPPYWALRDYGVAGQLGLELTFQEYITKLCDIFDEIKRVLKPEGTCWVNLGDTYFNKENNNRNFKQDGNLRGGGEFKIKKMSDVPTKSLCCIPDRFKIEMINRGWICRNEIIWFKPNCMPSSAKDRFTVDYEKVFFFVKSKKYFFKTQYEPHKRKWWNEDWAKSGYNKSKQDGSARAKMAHERGEGFKGSEQGRNKRCVWQVTTKPFKEAHFATYPEKLIEPMIDAGCPVGGVVLDPFFGSGTTGVVAKKQGKSYIGLELNPDYIKIAQARINETKVDNKLF